jgi:hypothetical protein
MASLENQVAPHATLADRLERYVAAAHVQRFVTLANGVRLACYRGTWSPSDALPEREARPAETDEAIPERTPARGK